MADDYSKEPISLGEIRAKRDDKASSWTVREALVNTLRRIDAGEFEAQNMVMMIETADSYVSVIATPDMDKTMALFHRGLRDS